MNETALVVTRAKNLLAKTAALARQPLFANAGHLTCVKAVGSLAGFAFWGLAAHLYQPEEVGTASAVLSAVALVSGIAKLGMDHGLVRLLPKSRSPHRFLNTAFTANTVAALLAGAVFLGGLSLWSPALVALQKSVLYAATFLVYAATATLGTVVQTAFVARRRAFYALLHTCVVNGGRLILVALLASLGASGLIGSVVLGFMLALAVSLWGSLPRVEPGYRPRPDVSWPDLAVIVPYSLGNYVAGLLAQTSQTVLPLLTLEILGPASSGHAYVALMLGGLLTSPGTALAGSALAEGANAPRNSLSILTRATALGLVLTVLGGVLLGVVAPWLLQFFGSSYAQEATGLLRWLALAAPLTVMNWLYFAHLRVQERIGRLILLSGIVAAATLGVSAMLMPRFGIAANGVGSLVGNGLVTAIALSQVVRRNRIGWMVRDVKAVFNVKPGRP